MPRQLLIFTKMIFVFFALVISLDIAPEAQEMLQKQGHTEAWISDIFYA